MYDYLIVFKSFGAMDALKVSAYDTADAIRQAEIQLSDSDSICYVARITAEF